MALHTSAQKPARVLIVIATLGRRPVYLRQTIDSIQSQSLPVDMIIVAPPENPEIVAISAEFGIPVLPDPGSLPEAINVGASALKTHHEFINWLNDDDYLEPESMQEVLSALDSDPSVAVAFGHCRYVDTGDRELWVSRAGSLAPKILPWGPDLIPQPGMLVRATAWREAGGVDPSFDLAFDLDLLLRLKKIGKLVCVNRVVSNFRWHPDSLTVEDRNKNLRESERAKRAALPKVLRPVSRVWDVPVRAAIKLAARRVTAAAQRQSLGNAHD